MLKEKFLQVRDKFIDRLEKFWNDNKEEIAEEVEKKLGFEKPIKLYSMVDEMYDIFEGLWNISTYWSKDDFSLDYSNYSGFYCQFKKLNQRIEIEQIIKKNNITSYNVTFGEDDDICTFWFEVEPKRVRDLKIHNNKYTAMGILEVFVKMLIYLEPYKKQVMNNKDVERKQQIYNNKQARELEEIK